MSRIPPPQIPSGADDDRDDSVLLIPFVLADAARLQLEYLSEHPVIPEDARVAISDWLKRYNRELVGWLRDELGEEAVVAANALSRYAAEMMNRHAAQAMSDGEDELFSFLEREMGNE